MQTAGAEHGGHPSASGTLVIFTRVEGLLCQRTGALCEMPPDALTALVAARVPLVLVSESADTTICSSSVFAEKESSTCTDLVICNEGAS